MTQDHPALLTGRTVTVSVPATSANLGPGFDALGLALELRDRVTARLDVGDGADREFSAEVTVHGQGEETLPKDESHLIVRLMRQVWEDKGLATSGVRLTLTAENAIPHARGLGSSASAVITALVLANELMDPAVRMSRDEIFQRGSAVEGHPDNIAPAVFGLLTASWTDEDEAGGCQYGTAVIEPHASLVPVVGIPSFEVSTEAVRASLPAQVPHAVAAANSGRAALVTLALTSLPEHLLEGTRDFLHQDARAEAMRPSYDAMTQLRRLGVPAVISGAGPTVLALARTEAEAAAAVEEFTRRGFDVRTPGFSRDGARLEA